MEESIGLVRERLRRAISGYTQTEIKKMSGLSYTTIWRFLKGYNHPTLTNYNKILTLLVKLEGGQDNG